MMMAILGQEGEEGEVVVIMIICCLLGFGCREHPYLIHGRRRRKRSIRRELTAEGTPDLQRRGGLEQKPVKKRKRIEEGGQEKGLTSISPTCRPRWPPS
jgi:hypothetical protein